MSALECLLGPPRGQLSGGMSRRSLQRRAVSAASQCRGRGLDPTMTTVPRPCSPPWRAMLLSAPQTPPAKAYMRVGGWGKERERSARLCSRESLRLRDKLTHVYAILNRSLAELQLSEWGEGGGHGARCKPTQQMSHLKDLSPGGVRGEGNIHQPVNPAWSEQGLEEEGHSYYIYYSNFLLALTTPGSISCHGETGST